MKSKTLIVRITPRQEEILRREARTEGLKVSEYVRVTLFMRTK